MATNDTDNRPHVVIDELHIPDRNIQNMVMTLARILVDKTLIEQGAKPADHDQ